MRAPRSPTSVLRPAGSRSVQSSSRASARRRAQLLGARPAPGQAQVLLERAVEHVGVLGDQPDRPSGNASPSRSEISTPSSVTDPLVVGKEPQQHPGERRLPGAAAGRRPPRAGPGSDRGRPRRAPAASGARVGEAQAAHPQGVRRRRERERMRRLAHRRRACPSPRTRARPSGARAGASASPPGRPVTSSKATSGISAIPASSTPFRLPGVDRRDADRERAPHRQAAAQARQALADAGGAGGCAGDAGQLARPRRAPAAAAPSAAPLTASSGAPSIRSTTVEVSSPRAAACRASLRAASRAGQPRHERRRRSAARRAGSGRRPGASTTPARPSPRRRSSGDRERAAPRAAAGPAASRRRARSRASRSPLRNAGRPSGASRSRRS